MHISEESAAAVRKTVKRHQGNRFFALCYIAAFPYSHKAFLCPLVLLSKSSKVLDHMLRREYTVYCFEILWIGHMLRYHTDGFSESPTTVSLLLC